MHLSAIKSGALALVIALASLVMLNTSLVRADEACQYTIEGVLPTLASDPHFLIEDQKAVAAMLDIFKAAGEEVPADVTRIILVKIPDASGVLHLYYGLEVNGCLLPPHPVPVEMDFPAAMHEGLSGSTPHGVFA